jgi:hypothetical protein
MNVSVFMHRSICLGRQLKRGLPSRPLDERAGGGSELQSVSSELGSVRTGLSALVACQSLLAAQEPQ